MARLFGLECAHQSCIVYYLAVEFELMSSFILLVLCHSQMPLPFLF